MHMKRILAVAVLALLNSEVALADCVWVPMSTTLSTDCTVVGIGTTAPFGGALLSNHGTNMNDGTTGMNARSFSWQSSAAGYAAGIENTINASSANGLLIKTSATSPSSTPLTLHAMNGMTSILAVRGNGRIGINELIPANALDVNGPSDTTSYPGTPVTMTVASSHSYTTVNNGAGIGFDAYYRAGYGHTTIAVISAVKEQAIDNSSAGALTFGTRANGTGTATATLERMRINSQGQVMIGTTTPEVGKELTVYGDAHFTGEVTGGTISAHYQDVAEWVPATVPMEPGTVVVLNPRVSNEVMPSSRSYDTTVAGVVSAQPGILLGVGSPTKEQIATTGRVKVKVDASEGPIAIGDILVTSDRSGMAMKSKPIDVAGIAIHRPGTVIGKALEPLASGEGEILVLLSLQ